MSDFSTEASIIVGLANAPSAGFEQDIYKTSITIASGHDYSCWTAAGAPAAGVAPTTWAHPTFSTLGACNPKQVNPAAGATCRLLGVNARLSVANQPVIVRDRLGHMGGLSGTVTTAQTVGATLTTPAANGRCQASGADVDWWLEWYTATGSTAVNATVAVTYSDNSTGNIVVALPASVTAFRRYRIVPASGNLSIKGITSVTLSATTGTAGNFGVTATNRLFEFSIPVANTDLLLDWAALCIPVVGSNACMELSTFGTTTALGTIIANFKAGVA